MYYIRLLVDSFNCIFWVYWRRIILNRHNRCKKERKRDKKESKRDKKPFRILMISWNKPLFSVFKIVLKSFWCFCVERLLMRSANSPFTRSVCLKLWIVCKNYFHKHKIRTLWKIESMNMEQAYDHENENPLVQILPGIIIRNLSNATNGN